MCKNISIKGIEISRFVNFVLTWVFGCISSLMATSIVGTYDIMIGLFPSNSGSIEYSLFSIYKNVKLL